MKQIEFNMLFQLSSDKTLKIDCKLHIYMYVYCIFCDDANAYNNVIINKMMMMMKASQSNKLNIFDLSIIYQKLTTSK